MDNMELPFDQNSWFWISSIVAAMNDSESDCAFPHMPLIDVNAPCPSFTDTYTLIIGQGGLRNRETPKIGKVLFKENVLPYLMKSIESDSAITGKLELHLAQGVVKKAILHYN